MIGARRPGLRGEEAGHREGAAARRGALLVQDRGRVITSEYTAKVYLIWDGLKLEPHRRGARAHLRPVTTTPEEATSRAVALPDRSLAGPARAVARAPQVLSMWSAGGSRRRCRWASPLSPWASAWFSPSARGAGPSRRRRGLPGPDRPRLRCSGRWVCSLGYPTPFSSVSGLVLQLLQPAGLFWVSALVVGAPGFARAHARSPSRLGGDRCSASLSAALAWTSTTIEVGLSARERPSSPSGPVGAVVFGAHVLASRPRHRPVRGPAARRAVSAPL